MQGYANEGFPTLIYPLSKRRARGSCRGVGAQVFSHIFGSQPRFVHLVKDGERLRNLGVSSLAFWNSTLKNPSKFRNFSMRSNFGILRPFSALKHFVLKFLTLVKKGLSVLECV